MMMMMMMGVMMMTMMMGVTMVTMGRFKGLNCADRCPQPHRSKGAGRIRIINRLYKLVSSLGHTCWSGFGITIIVQRAVTRVSNGVLINLGQEAIQLLGYPVTRAIQLLGFPMVC